MITVVLGLQWGDEGKGKIIDYLSHSAHMVVRFQGGDNAGHTINIGNKQFINHIVPSGIFHKNIVNIVGNGVVINLDMLRKELKDLEKNGINTENLLISKKAHVIFDLHKLLDTVLEKKGENIGTTKRGIGPAYGLKHLRLGLRLSDFDDEKTLQTRVKELIDYANIYLKHFKVETLEYDKSVDKLKKQYKFIKKYITETEYIINEAIKEGKNIIFEGAQGTFLDIDFGTYPYVTSSNTTISGVISGSGVSPKNIDRIIGVTKAYTTRVGKGPFPTELYGKWGDFLQKEGREYGATTKRKRHVGWLDLFLLKYAIMINGIDSIALTKLDVLSQLPTIKICTGYRYKGKNLAYFPSNAEILNVVEPVYVEMEGWQRDISNVNTFSELPQNAKKYIAFIEKYLEKNIDIISFGAKRRETIEK